MADDERYIVIDGRRWRRADPSIPEALKSELVSELMSARRAVKAAKKDDDEAALQSARARVADAKVALGERGRPWWKPPDEPSLRKRLASTLRALLRKRETGDAISLSEAARVAGGNNWPAVMNLARKVARQLEGEDWIEVIRQTAPAGESSERPIRLRRRS